jgi:hypothetical protein
LFRSETWTRRRGDVNGDGVIDRADYEAEARRIAEAFGETAGSARGRAVRDARPAMYRRQAEAAGAGPDGAMTREQGGTAPLARLGRGAE